MNARLLPALLLLAATPLFARADESPPAHAEQTATASVDAEQLPYGAGYEARRRAAERQEQSPGRESAAGQERIRTQADRPAETRPARRDADRESARRESRREARERWGHHGGRRN